jgi:putative MATE family efflux protein
MNKSLSKEMTNGSEIRHIIMFALPLLGGNLLQQLYNIVDTLIVGRFLGDNALAAVGATGSMTFLFSTICMGLSVGSGVIISQYFGAGQINELKSAVFNSAITTAFFGIIISIAAIFLSRPVLMLMQTPDSLLPESAGYMRITCGGTLVVAAYNWINSVMRSLGDSKTPLIFLGAASVMNVLLDLLFVVVLGLGVNGAACATVISQGSSAIACMIFAFSQSSEIRLKKCQLKADRLMIAKCIKMGLPIAAQNAMIAISMVALQHVTNTFGETIMAAYTVSMRIEQFIQQPFQSLNVAVATFTGQNTGAGQNERVRKGFNIGIRLSLAFAAIAAFFFFLCGKSVVGCFVQEKNVIEIGTRAIQLTSCFYAFLGLIHITRGFLNGVGDTGYAMANGLAEVVCRVVFSLILTRIAFIGYWGIWGTTCITWLVTAAIGLIRYKRGSWKTKAAII